MDRWQGKVAIVTGASSGMGAATAESLAKAGMLVVGLARRVDRIQAHAARLQQENIKGKLYAFQCDMRNEADILAAFDWTLKNVGLVHVLVNNAGVADHTNLVGGDTEQWRMAIETNVLGLCIATREALKMMMTHRIHGHVHINSIGGQQHLYMPVLGVYSATKHAVRNLTEMLRMEMVALKSNIKVTSISPGPTRTDGLNVDKLPEEIRKQFDSMPALDGQDIADAILYVLSVPERVHVNELTIRPTNSQF